MNELLTSGGLVAVIIALNTLIGKYIDSKWLPLSSVGLGVIGALLIGGLSVEMVIKGLIFGLSACGIYDQKKLLTK